MPDLIPYGRQTIDDEDVEAVIRVLRSDYLTTGPAVGAFEVALHQRTGARHAAVVSSGTAALHAAYAAIGVGPGDEVITSPLTFAATGNAALYLGARPVFADVDPDTGCLDPAAVEAAMTERTRAIVAVDFAGHPADYRALQVLADGREIPVIADAAHSLGAVRDGSPVGTLATATTLSFHPVKHITTCEGGAVLTDDPSIDERIKAFRTHGIVRDPARLGTDEGPWYHEMQALGFNYRLSDVQCALGLAQLVKLDRFLERRRAIAAVYDEELAGIEALTLPHVATGVVPAWHLYVIRVADPRRRRAFFEALRADGLGVQVHYIPVYRHPYYRSLGHRVGECPIAEDWYARSVSLPIFPGMVDADVARVVETVRRVASRLLV